MRNLNIVIIAYDWPPRNSIAVHRPYSWAKYLTKLGAKICVITSEKCLYDYPLDLNLPKLDNVEVVEVKYREGSVLKNDSYFKKLILEFFKKNSKFIKKIYKKNMDIRDRWAKFAIPVALNYVRENNVDVVISTYGPRSSHYIAKSIKEENSGVCWIADYRDLWSIRHNSNLEGKIKIKEKNLELKTIESADIITTVSPPLAKDLESFLSKRVEVIYNGFDINNLKNNKILEYKIDGCKNKGRKLNIVYTGMIYYGWQDPSPLFQSINQLILEEKIKPVDVCIDFYGKNQEGLRGLVNRNQAESYVRIHGHVSREEALKAQKNADLLLLLESNREDARGVVTGKIFEYMIAGVPILSIGSRHDSTIANIIKSTGVGVICENDISKIFEVLITVMAGRKGDFYQPNFDKINYFSHENQTRKLFELINELV